MSEEADVRREFADYRQRMKKALEEAKENGRDDAALSLLDLVDDCDRALEVLHKAQDRRQFVLGIEQLQKRALKRFQVLGFESFAEAGDKFDPRIHEAISVEAGEGPDGSISRVHQRGWRRKGGGKVVRTAMVTVIKGAGLPTIDVAQMEDAARSRRRRRPAAQTQGDYQCPYGVIDCVGDCADCRFSRKINTEGGSRK